jgi:hypothetical protein
MLTSLSSLSFRCKSILAGVGANKAARDFTASIALEYMLTRKITILGINNDLPGLDRLLKHKQRL